MGGRSKREQAGGADAAHEDAAVWDYVTQDVEKVRMKERVPTEPARDPPLPPQEPRWPPPALPARSAPAPAAGGDERPPAPLPSRKPPSRPPPEPVVIERRKVRRIARGHQEIEARLDLHGMREREAHAELAAFVRRCHANGLRTVLVITGKGGTGADDAGEPGPMPARRRGVLKRSVPLWLASPELAPLVLATSPAHAAHGGDGAIYVTLRRKG